MIHQEMETYRLADPGDAPPFSFRTSCSKISVQDPWVSERNFRPEKRE